MPTVINVYTYQTTWTLVECQTEYEWKTTWYFHGGTPIPSQYRRKFETRTYEAILTEELPNEPSAYYHNSDIPTEDNAKTLVNDSAIAGDDWKLQSIEYTKSLSTPISRDCRITFLKQYAWEHITPSSSN